MKSQNTIKNLTVLLFCIVLLSCYLSLVFGVPIGPSATEIRNETKTNAANWTHNQTPGYIYWYNLNADEQNQRWKGYVGNISGSLSLDNSDGASIFQWDLGTIQGEVYATWNDTPVQWSQVNCTWAVDGNKSNRTVGENENARLSHTGIDNITATFNYTNHTSFNVGSITIPANDCHSTNTFQNDSRNETFFYELLLYDGTTPTDGKVIYTTLIEDNVDGFSNETVDFQMIVPDSGATGWTSSILYYFYVELS